MNRVTTMAGGLGLGAGLMFLLDPQQGRRRRALIRDKINSLVSSLDDAACVVGRDIGHRACGIAAETWSLAAGGEAPDYVIKNRIRSKLGRVISHPGAITVRCHNGQVSLSGPILAHEVDNLLKCVSKISGVQSVRQSLDVHKEAGNISALQGGRDRPAETLDWLPNRWSPATRFLLGSTGLGLLGYGFTKSAPQACVLGTVGLGLLARSLVNRGIRQLAGQVNVPDVIGGVNEQVGDKLGQVQSSLGIGRQKPEPAVR